MMPEKDDVIRVTGYDSKFVVLWVVRLPIPKARCRVYNGTDEYEFPDYKIQEIVKKSGKKRL